MTFKQVRILAGAALVVASLSLASCQNDGKNESAPKMPWKKTGEAVEADAKEAGDKNRS